MDKKMLISFFLFSFANVLVWFQVNSQFIWKWWKEHPILTVLIYSIPTSLCFFFGWKFAVESLGKLWSAKMFAFGISTVMFYILTYLILNEGLTTKNSICLGLSVLIIIIQVFWK